MKITKIAKDITVVNMKRVVEIYEKIKLHAIVKIKSRKGYHPSKGKNFDRFV